MSKKKILLRLDPNLHEALRKWAEEDFRSVNSHIEFLLKKAVGQRRRSDSSEE
ncbi:MAG: toxin-antitoxin system HicB family antitoxin [Candidatus Poseidoniales archaeon]|nr:toxin-antitoxin system HicB family antitoxin [Candidatus Poseidoniales archaeon]